MSNLTNEFKGKLKKYFHVKLGAFTYRHGWDKCKCHIVVEMVNLE